MNKKELLTALTEKTSLASQSEAKVVLGALEEILLADLKAGNSTKLFEFGTFKPVDVAARTARNPRTGEPIDVPAKKVIKFTVASNFKDLNKL